MKSHGWLLMITTALADPEGGVFGTIKALTNTHAVWSLWLCTPTRRGHVQL